MPGQTKGENNQRDRRRRRKTSHLLTSAGIDNVLPGIQQQQADAHGQVGQAAGGPAGQ